MFGCLWGRDSIVYSSVCLHVSRHCVCSSCRSVSSSESSWQTHHWTPGAVPGSRRGKLIFILLISWTSQDFLWFFLFSWLCYMKVTYLKMAKKAQLEEAYCSRLTTNRTKNLRSFSIVYLENNRSFSLCKIFCFYFIVYSFFYLLFGRLPLELPIWLWWPWWRREWPKLRPGRKSGCMIKMAYL